MEKAKTNMTARTVRVEGQRLMQVEPWPCLMSLRPIAIRGSMLTGGQRHSKDWCPLLAQPTTDHDLLRETRLEEVQRLER